MFERAQRIFESVCELTGEAREDALRRACEGDDELLGTVRELLRADERSLFFDDGAIDPELALKAPAEAPLPERIGRYRIIALLGEGGMGVVYQARQESPARDVALKVIRPGLASRSALARFAHEGEILGRLHHPGIAQILEAGSAGEGGTLQPYFAMELIEGRPVTSFVRERNPSVRERLELLIKICDAVQHAHERGVIHRDLKPANILVTDTGQPKILDFGIARLTDADVLTTTMHTGRGQLLGTLPYMSPEQVVGDPDKIDHRSDVYALGVIAYEVLCGELPLNLRDKPISEAAGIICSEEPSKLGTINRSMRGDIETIVATAMDKDPQRRYQSAADFRSDIERHLGDDPIVARPPSLLYQTRKFARRNKAAVGAVGAIFVVMVVATIVSTKLAIDTSRALEAEKLATKAAKASLEAEIAAKKAAQASLLAEQEAKAKAQLEAAKATSVTVFLERMLLAASPWGRAGLSGPEVTLSQFLETAVNGLGEFEGEPEVEASLLMTIGATYKELGKVREAEPLLARAVEIRERELEPHHPMIGEALRHLGTTRVRLGRVDAGIADLRRALRIMEQELGPEDWDVSKARSDLGWALYANDQLDEAREVMLAAVDSMGAHENPDGHVFGTALVNLGAVEKRLGNLDSAVKFYEAGIIALGRDSLTSAMVESNLGNIAYARGEYDRAEAMHRDALRVLEANLDPYHPTIGTVLNNLGLALAQLGRQEESVQLQMRAMEISARVYGKDSRDYIIGLGNIAYDLDALGRYQEAADAWITVADWYARNDPASPKGPIRKVRAYCTLAGRGMDWEEAESLLLESYDHLVDLGGEDHQYVPIARGAIAEFYDRWGKPDQAAVYRQTP